MDRLDASQYSLKGMVQQSLASNSSISLATTLAVEPQSPKSPTSVRRSPFNTSSIDDSGPIDVENTTSSTHTLSYSGAGRFWKPPEASDKKGGRLRGWRKWSDQDTRNDNLRLPYMASRISLNEGKPLEDNDPLSQRRFSAEQSKTDITRISSLSDGAASVLSLPNESSHSPPVYEVRDETATDFSEENFQSLAQRIAINERKNRTRELLKKLQQAEEERLKQMDRDETLSELSKTPDLSRNTSDASDRSHKNVLMTPPSSLPGPFQPSKSTSELGTGNQLPSIEVPDHREKLREPADSRLVNLVELEEPIPELPSKLYIPELADTCSNSDPLDEDSLFSDLDFLVGALRKKPNTLSIPSQRTRALSTSSYNELKHDWSSGPSYVTSSTNNNPNVFELTAPSPAPEPPNLFELSSSNSVIHRPLERKQALPRRYTPIRHHSDLKIYNTLPHEPPPIRGLEQRIEMPAKYENEIEVPYSGPRINIEPVIDPRTGKIWANR